MFVVADMHCHILPGLDDGAKNREVMERMLKMSYDSGVRAMIATSHYNPRSFKYSLPEYEQRLMLATMNAMDIDEQYRIYSGQEIFFANGTVDDLMAGRALPLAQSRYVLVEFAPYHNYEYIRNAVNELLIHGYWPIIAHVERYDTLFGNVDKVAELIDSGAYIQSNASHVTGAAGGKRMHSFLHKLLKNGMVHFIASDGHNVERRPTELGKCAEYVCKKYGMSMYERIFVDDPERIIGKEMI